MQRNIEEHQRNRSIGSPRDFIDVYLDEMDKESGGKSNYSSMNQYFYFNSSLISIYYLLLVCKFLELQLASTISDLFSAGAESTSNSIGGNNFKDYNSKSIVTHYLMNTAFAIIHLLHNPESQKKMQAELDAVCGDSLPNLNQKAR